MLHLHLWTCAVLALWALATAAAGSSHPNAEEDAPAESCRDRFLWPFSSTSIWNTPLGSGAQMVPAQLFELSMPDDFHNDQDFILRVTAEDPLTPWYNQGWWGARNHCDIAEPSPAAMFRLPFNFTTASDDGRSPPWQSNNNAMGVLLEDNVTLVQMQPIYRCAPGSPMLARFGNDTDGCPQNFPNVTSILGDGALGAHGGSGLSSVGGTIRLGELLPGAPPIRHALKLELCGSKYYFSKPLQPPSAYNGNRTHYVWPATGSDSCSLSGCYTGTNPHVAPGALLAVPQQLGGKLRASGKVTSTIGKQILAALETYGGYIVDDTGGGDSVAICMDAQVNAEMRQGWCASLTPALPPPSLCQSFFTAPPQQTNNIIIYAPDAAYGFNMAYPHGVSLTSPGGGGELYRELLHIFRALHAVTNNGPGNIGGGGTPLAPPAPPICGAEDQPRTPPHHWPHAHSASHARKDD